MEWATPVNHRRDYRELRQEQPRAYAKDEDGLLQGLTIRLALWPHSFLSVSEVGTTSVSGFGRKLPWNR